jgi:anthranilate synthase component 1
MYTPTFERFVENGKNGRVEPVRRRIPADLETPVSAFLKLRAGFNSGKGASFLLESVERGIQVGRYSFIGIAPHTTLRLENDTVEIHRNGETERHSLDDRDPLDFVRAEIERTPKLTGAPVPGPFAGAVGYISYEIARYFEKLPQAATDPLGLPDYQFVIPRTLVIFDHVKSEIEIVTLPDGRDAEAAYHSARKEIEAILEALNTPLARGNNGGSREKTPHKPQPNMPRADFESLVRSAKEHILAGDAYQIVLSQRLGAGTTASPFEIYRALRILNPSPYMFFFDFEDFQMIGSSPEILVRLDGRAATLSPIAGTRRRGETPADDQRLEEELKTDEKERAEHVMLVDLGRNDLGRVCDTGTVQTESFQTVERYSHVMHMVSRVTGRLRDDLDGFDLVRAAFPAGTVSGAPKIRAMELIAEYENDRRGPYAGAVGYFGNGGDVDMCITIRTILMKGNEYSVQAGAGIVADSDPAREYEETLSKMRAMICAVEIAEKGL